MKQKELLEKLEGEPKDSGDQIRLIKKFFSYMTGKNIRKLGGKMKFYYLKIILFHAHGFLFTIVIMILYKL